MIASQYPILLKHSRRNYNGPQIFVAVTSIAGLAGSAATALVLALPGDIRIWTIVAIGASTCLVLWGKFKAIERTATILAVTLGIAATIAAISVFPQGDKLISGLVPTMPENVEYEEHGGLPDPKRELL